MKSVRNRILAVTAAAVMSCVGAANAVPLASTDTLAHLIATGGSLQIGDKTFSGFSVNESGLTSFNAANITVTASIIGGIYYLDWSGNMSLASASGPVTADLKLGYTVTATAGLIYQLDANFTGSAVGGTLAVDETAKIASGQVVGQIYLNPAHVSDPPVVGNDLIDIVPPQPVLYVTKDMTFAITSAGGGLITISDVEQSFHQTSVPDGGATAMLLGAALTAMGLLRRKLIA